jgi:polysaccharide pyruvyl transferase WcaK-like protein
VTLYARLAVLAVILAALAGGAWKAYVMGKNSAKAEWAIEREAANEKARETRERNRTTALQAEIRYVQKETFRIATVRETLREVNHETENLATCALDAGDISVLRAAANRIREDRPAAVNPDNTLPPAR